MSERSERVCGWDNCQVSLLAGRAQNDIVGKGCTYLSMSFGTDCVCVALRVGAREAWKTFDFCRGDKTGCREG